jgi:hypothetical protein
MTAETKVSLDSYQSVADTRIGDLTAAVISGRYGPNSKKFKNFQDAIKNAKEIHVQLWALLELTDELLKSASGEKEEKLKQAKEKIEAFLENKDYKPDSVNKFIFGTILPKPEEGILASLEITQEVFLNKVQNVHTRLGKETPPENTPPMQSLVSQFTDQKILSQDAAAAIVAFQWASRALCIANGQTPPKHWAPSAAASDPIWLQQMCNAWYGYGYEELVRTAKGPFRPPAGSDGSFDFNQSARKIAAAGFTRARDELYHAGYHDLVKKITNIMKNQNLQLDESVRQSKAPSWQPWNWNKRAPAL